MILLVLHGNAGKQQIKNIVVSIGYVMSNGDISKLTLACQLLDEVMPILEKRQVILLFDSWYARRELLATCSQLSESQRDLQCTPRYGHVRVAGFDGRPSRPSTKVR